MTNGFGKQVISLQNSEVQCDEQRVLAVCIFAVFAQNKNIRPKLMC